MIFEKTYDKITNSIDLQISQAFETRNWDANQIEIKKEKNKRKRTRETKISSWKFSDKKNEWEIKCSL